MASALPTGSVLIFVAGPNGSGKTTFFEEYLEGLGLPFVNADRIARALRVADPSASSNEVDQRAFTAAEGLRTAFVEAGLSFCTESVFSDPARAKIELLQRARARGFTVFLIFIGIDNPVLSVARVKQRAELHARFPRTSANLRAAIPLVEEAVLFDNSSYDDPYRIVAVYQQGRLVSRHPPIPPWARGLPGL